MKDKKVKTYSTFAIRFCFIGIANKLIIKTGQASLWSVKAWSVIVCELFGKKQKGGLNSRAKYNIFLWA